MNDLNSYVVAKMIDENVLQNRKYGEARLKLQETDKLESFSFV